MTSNINEPAVAVLETGERYEGISYGATGRAIGFLTPVAQATGYQEVLTAVEQTGRIILFSAPHIGVVGVNDDDAGGDRITAAGIIVRDPARRHSNFRAQRSLSDELLNFGTVGICGIDTRAIVRRVRAASVPLRIGIFSGDEASLDHAEQVALVQQFEGAE